MKPQVGPSKPIAIDLFAGAGGTTLALKRSGFDVPVAIEIDPVKAATLFRNQPDTAVLGLQGTNGDVTKVVSTDIYRAGLPRDRPLDLLVACPPCQGYSTQGKQNPRDPRNFLFEHVLRLAAALRPKAVVVENVPGMASTADGTFLSQLLSGLQGLGFETEVWKLTASRFGVPQDRQRLFIVAASDVVSPPRGRGRSPTTWEAIADLPETTFRPAARRAVLIGYRRASISGYASQLRGRQKGVTGVEKSRHARRLVRRISHLRWGEIDPLTKHRRLHPFRPASTLTAGTRTRTACRPIHPYRNRTLTVREAARLASFPDWYEFHPVISEAWNEIGNAVPPLMAQAVFQRVRSALRSS